MKFRVQKNSLSSMGGKLQKRHLKWGLNDDDLGGATVSWLFIFDRFKVCLYGKTMWCL